MAAAFLLAALALGPLLAESSGSSGAPYYAANSIANTAANVAGLYAPNTFLTIYGQNLSYVTRALAAEDIHGGMLPTELPGTGVHVLVNATLADIYYVSPTQVNILAPLSLVSGPAAIQLIDNGVAGPVVTIQLGTAAPAVFQQDAVTVIATHGNGPLVTPDNPAAPNEVVVLYAAGLGPTLPAGVPNQIPQSAAQLAAVSDFRVLLNGVPVDPSRVQYVGVTPGFAGLFQINLKLPADAPPNPEIRIGYADQLSPASRILPLL